MVLTFASVALSSESLFMTRSTLQRQIQHTPFDQQHPPATPDRNRPPSRPTPERMDRIGCCHIEPEIARGFFSRQEWRISDPEALAQAIRDVNAAIRLLRWRRRRLEAFKTPPRVEQRLTGERPSRQHLPTSTRNSSISCG